VVLASAVTLAVLPAIWLINRKDDTASPNVAAVGLSADGSAAATTTTTRPDLMGSLPPRYLTGTNDSIPQPTVAPVAVGRVEGIVIGSGTATYRRDVERAGWCLTDAVEAGLDVTVVNLDNGRSIRCTTQPRSGGRDQEDVDEDPVVPPADELVLLPDDFAQLADLTDAPVPIEIRQ
jgi:hypothetical protein